MRTPGVWQSEGGGEAWDHRAKAHGTPDCFDSTLDSHDDHSTVN